MEWQKHLERACFRSTQELKLWRDIRDFGPNNQTHYDMMIKEKQRGWFWVLRASKSWGVYWALARRQINLQHKNQSIWNQWWIIGQF